MKELPWVEYTQYNERDIEGPFTLEVVERSIKDKNVQTVLDVGCHYSGHTYAPGLRKLLKDQIYDGVDIVSPDIETLGILNNYKVGNVTETYLEPYDLVFSISVIEHCGITSYKKEDIVTEQITVFKRLVELTNKVLFVTCPYGLEGLHPGQYSNITPELLEEFKLLAKDKLLVQKTKFYYNKFCQGKEKWYEVNKEYADNVPLSLSLGVQCILVLEFSKD